MDRAVTNLRSRYEPKSDGGFKFAITLITVCISVLFFIHNYAENNLIPFLSVNYLILSSLIAFSIILLLYIGAYILFKGISLEVKDPEKKETYENTATDFYVEAFIAAIYLILGILFGLLWHIPNHLGVIISDVVVSYILTFRLDVFEPLIDSKENEPNPRLKRLLLPLLTFKALLVERYPKLKLDLSITRLKFLLKESTLVKRYVELKPHPLTIKLLILNFFILVLDILYMIQLFYPIWNWDNQIINSLMFFIIYNIFLYIYAHVIMWYIELKPITLELSIFKFSLFLLRIIIMFQIYLITFFVFEIYSKTEINLLIITVIYYLFIYHYVARWNIFKPLELAYFSKIKYIQFFMILGSIITILLLPSTLSGHLIAE